MKREILFKAITINTKEWMEGITIANGTIKRKRFHVFMQDYNNTWVGVNPDTLCQYTGIKDKNGKKIFEGDYFKLGDEKDVF